MQTLPRFTVSDRCDNFYEVTDRETGRAARGVPMNGRFTFRSSAQQAADALNRRGCVPA